MALLQHIRANELSAQIVLVKEYNVGDTIGVGAYEVKLVSTIARGTYGQVWRVLARKDGTDDDYVIRALKISLCPDPKKCGTVTESFHREVRVLKACEGCPRVVRLVDYHLCANTQHTASYAFGNVEHIGRTDSTMLRPTQHIMTTCHSKLLLELADDNLDGFIEQHQFADTISEMPASKDLPYSFQLTDYADGDTGALRYATVQATPGTLSNSPAILYYVYDGVVRAIQQFRAACMVPGALSFDTDEPMHVVHRDLKNSNIVVTNGLIQLADFGLAEWYPHSMVDNPPFISSGTPTTADPLSLEEDPNAINPGSKMDEYSLGAMLWMWAFDGREITHNDVYNRAVNLIGKTNAPDLLNDVISLTHPDLDARTSIDDLLLQSRVLRPFVDRENYAASTHTIAYTGSTLSEQVTPPWIPRRNYAPDTMWIELARATLDNAGDPLVNSYYDYWEKEYNIFPSMLRRDRSLTQPLIVTIRSAQQSPSTQPRTTIQPSVQELFSTQARTTRRRRAKDAASIQPRMTTRSRAKDASTTQPAVVPSTTLLDNAPQRTRNLATTQKPMLRPSQPRATSTTLRHIDELAMSVGGSTPPMIDDEDIVMATPVLAVNDAGTLRGGAFTRNTGRAAVPKPTM